MGEFSYPGGGLDAGISPSGQFFPFQFTKVTNDSADRFNEMKPLFPGPEWQTLSDRSLVHMRQCVEQGFEISPHNNILRHALSEYRKLGQRAQLLQFTKFLRVLRQAGEFDRIVFGNLEFFEIINNRIFRGGGCIAVFDHIAKGIIKRERLRKDLNQLGHRSFRVTTAVEELQGLVVIQVNVVGRSVFPASTGPFWAVEVFGQAGKRGIHHDGGRERGPHGVPLRRELRVRHNLGSRELVVHAIAMTDEFGGDLAIVVHHGLLLRAFGGRLHQIDRKPESNCSSNDHRITHVLIE